ncbi:MAG: helix-turn-helix transcriptional regulator [Nocardioidaceae bacterium]|nr:MAG: helix-turn-helix transcriptional regulator [Nocardioidaceae bacterium]
MTQPTDEALGVALRTLRKTVGMTLDDVSRAAGISGPYLSNVESGKVRPTADWVRTVMAAIGSQIRDAA